VTFRDGGQDEAGFIRDAVTMILNRFCVDSARIYASGYSGGGRMLSQFLCNGNDQFAAAGFVASLRAGYPKEQDGVWAPDAASCAPARPVSIIAFAGLKDPANPYQGGGKAYWRYGGEVALKRWAELDGCKGSVKSEAGTAIIFSSYDVCKSGSRIFSYVIDGWGHAWPKSAMQPEVMKASADVQRKTTPDTLRQVDAADRMWDFFRNTDGQLVVGAAIKKDCGGQAVSASLTVKTSETTCSQPTKTSSKEPAAEGAL
jgi:polyhydroxybutyrate depolymerase